MQHKIDYEKLMEHLRKEVEILRQPVSESCEEE